MIQFGTFPSSFGVTRVAKFRRCLSHVIHGLPTGALVKVPIVVFPGFGSEEDAGRR